MIAKSDLVILVLSASALGVGIARWQLNIAPETSERVSIPTQRTRAEGLAQPIPPDETQALNGASPSSAAPRTIEPLARDRSTLGTQASLPKERAASDGTVDAAPAAAGEPLYDEHVVVSGDTLGQIAQRYGTSVANLQALNELRGTTILVGQRLRYPQAAN